MAVFGPTASQIFGLILNLNLNNTNNKALLTTDGKAYVRRVVSFLKHANVSLFITLSLKKFHSYLNIL